MRTRKSWNTLSLTDAIRRGRQKGFVLLSKVYLNSKENLEWECQDKHVFYCPLSAIGNGRGCPHCHSGVKELKCRFIFEKCFDVKFSQTRKALGSHYQLDGYNELLKIAFEYQGEQHYTPAWYHKKDMSQFDNLQRIDQEKRKLCVDKKITCIEIPYWHAKTDEQLTQFLHEEFNRLEIVPNMVPLDVEMDKFPGRPSKLQEIKDILEETGGKLLDGKYISIKEKTLKIECKCGHVQQSAPQNIVYAARMNQGWCFSCGVKNRSKKRPGGNYAYSEAKKIKQRKFDYDKIKRLYAGGITMSEVAEKCRCSITTVHKAVHFGK